MLHGSAPAVRAADGHLLSPANCLTELSLTSHAGAFAWDVAGPRSKSDRR
jgi:hypothetical protein